ncbi:MAG TPA: IS110 family transposase [Bacteroidales bacterium]|nr:IS110 family transposase [Bacteroidales bacterium]
MAKKIKTNGGVKLAVINENVAGIDVSSTEMQVCVPEDRAEENNRVFGVFTEDLYKIADFLSECRIEKVSMESTGIYWVSIYKVLVERGFDVILVNARDVKNITGKKTDEIDAEWLMVLHSYGLLRPCFQPDNFTRELRNIIRHRENLVRSASKEVLHVQKSLEQMNIKLSNVISDILGKSGQAIIHSIIDGERSPEVLVELAEKVCKTPKEVMIKALNGSWDRDHLFTLQQSQEMYEYIQQKIVLCDKEVEKMLEEYCEKNDLENKKKVIRCSKIIGTKSKIHFDVEKYSSDIFGVNLMAIPGINQIALLKILGELGVDFIKNFENFDKFCSWCNLVPNNKISGGKLLSSRIDKKKNHVGLILRQSANSLKQNKSELGQYFRYQQSKKGYKMAIIATARKLAIIIYTMVKNQQEYDPHCQQEEYISNLQKKKAKLIRALQNTEKQLIKAS